MPKTRAARLSSPLDFVGVAHFMKPVPDVVKHGCLGHDGLHHGDFLDVFHSSSPCMFPGTERKPFVGDTTPGESLNMEQILSSA
jgi:hypothetical protein